MNIIYAGPLWEGTTCLQRMISLSELGHNITAIDTDPPAERKAKRTFSRRLITLCFGQQDYVGANAQIRKSLSDSNHEVLWIDKGLTIDPQTLQYGRDVGSTIVGYSPDDMLNGHNQSKQFLRGIGLYDVFFTTKSYGVEELTRLGCARVFFVGNAYDKSTHYPIRVSAATKARLGGKVGFIGHYEHARSESIMRIGNAGIRVRVWGSGWSKVKNSQPNIKCELKSVWGVEYSSAICSFDINLAFLCKANRDRQTTRSIEIPACGGFMLAERSDEHLELFEEGKEAEFFGSDDELVDKVRFYLVNQTVRQRIAYAGRERCIKGGYSNHERLSQMLVRIRDVRGDRAHISQHGSLSRWAI